MDCDGVEMGSGSGNSQHRKEKLLVSDEYFQRVTQALVMRLRQHEEYVNQEGNWCLSFQYVHRKLWDISDMQNGQFIWILVKFDRPWISVV